MDDQDALLSTDVELEDDADGFDYLPVEIAITTSKGWVVLNLKKLKCLTFNFQLSGYRQLRDVESDDESEEDSDYTVLTSLDDDMSDESDDSIGISMLKNKGE